MNEKRFTFGAVSPNVAMIKDNGEPMDIGEVVDKLNELSEENEQLKQKLELLDLNEKNNAVKMVDGKFFIKM